MCFVLQVGIVRSCSGLLAPPTPYCPPWLLAPSAPVHPCTPLHPQFSCTDHNLHPSSTPEPLQPQHPCTPVPCISPTQHCPHACTPQTTAPPAPPASLHPAPTAPCTIMQASPEENSKWMSSSLCPWRSHHTRVHLPEAWTSRSPHLPPSVPRVSGAKGTPVRHQESQRSLLGPGHPWCHLATPSFRCTSRGQGAHMARGSSCLGHWPGAARPAVAVPYGR